MQCFPTLRSARQLVASALLAGTLVAGSASAVTLVKYEMGQAGPQIENFVTGGDLTAGANATISVNSDFGYASQPVLQLNPNTGSSNTTDAMNNGRLFYFDVAINGDVSDADLANISFNSAKGGTSARDFGVSYQVNGGARIDFVTDVAYGNGIGTRPNFDFFSYSLAGEAALQNLAGGDVVRFLFAEDNDFTAEFDNILIEGDAVVAAAEPSAVPEPATMGLVVLAGAALLARRRQVR